MSFLDRIGNAAIQEQEGNELLASMLADSARTLARRLGHLLNKALSALPGEHHLR